jgi:CHAT domain-containing protein
LTKKPEKAIRFRDHAYLLREHSISYSFSATLLREMMQKKHQTIPTKPLLAYAPFFDGDTTSLAKIFTDDVTMRRNLTPLSNSGEEAYRIAKSMGGEAIVGKEATEQKFIETVSSARIIHLATHGQADDKSGDYSFLAFAPLKDSLENELLYVRDLYNLTLNADLVVLSACETGIGKLQRGEGIISLARAFAYAGSKSIVTSLWSVNDAKTKDLMLLFYNNLKKGKSKDAALREAKLSFINKNAQPNANPFFWAGFIGIGDMSKMR